MEEVSPMTAHRPKQTGPLEESAFIEVLFSGLPASGSGWLVSRHSRLWRPPTDVYETEDQIVVLMEIAGVRQEDFSIVLRERRLTISGVRLDVGPEPGERRAYHQMEVPFGEFRSDVDLPGPVDESRVTAEYSQGFLRVTWPKAKPQTIDLK
jgi:HSP20 family protein